MRTMSALGGLVLLAGCATAPPPTGGTAATAAAQAEALIDAFHSFDAERLRAALADAPDTRPRLLFYQGWAEGGNYKVLERRPCMADGPSRMACAITVRDDLITALGTGYWVTDTFHLTFDSGRIVKVTTTSNDPPQFEAALAWIVRERPEVMEGPCRGFFAGGPTPGDCVRAVVAGFAAYRAAAQQGR
jgi:hypothetical protein